MIHFQGHFTLAAAGTNCFLADGLTITAKGHATSSLRGKYEFLTFLGLFSFGFKVLGLERSVEWLAKTGNITSSFVIVSEPC